MNIHRILFVSALTLCSTLVYAQHDHRPVPGVTHAIAVLVPVGPAGAHGIVTFTQVEGGIRVVAHVEGLAPGKHGFHIHEFGDCSSADATSAGGHFNPGGMPHGAPTADKRHEGDLGNIMTAGKDGTADLDWVDSHLGFEGPTSIIGRGVIVHASEDDLKTQPTGNAGARVACGVIGIAK